jgi:hypothetical protein
MKFLSKSLLSIIFTSTIILAGNQDFINFENEDTLHGKFIGFTTSGKIIWKNDSAEKNIAFATQDVRKIVLNNGQKTKPFTHTSYVTLKNLDTIPGKVISLTKDQLNLETDFGGTISIPREKIFDININPLGDRILYRGPFSKDEGWEVRHPANRRSKNLIEKTDDEPWNLKNFSLNHEGQPSSILLKSEFPEKYRITFNSYSSHTYYPTFTIMADLRVPEYDEDDKDLKQNRSRYSSSLGNYLGTSLVIRLHPTSSRLTHYGFNEDGALFQKTITNTVSGISNRGTKTKIFYDVRVDKKSGLIMLYANKRLIGQWLFESFAKQFQESYFGYNMQYSKSSAKSVISDIVVSSWNGIRDSALSLENETRDIVMLNNGTDRYSGKVTAISNSVINLKSPYAELVIPQDQVSSVTFSRKKATEPEPRDKNDVAVRFYGTGRITGTLTKAGDNSIFLESKILGKIKIKSEFITSFEFIDMDHAYETFQ